MSDSDSHSDTEQSTPQAAAAAASSSHGAAASGDVAAQRAARKAAQAAAKAAKKAARPPPEVHLKNVPMMLVTCDSGKEALAKKEIMAWLNEYAERHFPRAAASGDDAPKAPVSVSSGLEAELAALQAEARAERASASAASAVTSAQLGVRFKLVGDMAIFRGLFLVAVLDPSINIVQMVCAMLDEVRETKVFKTRYCVHLHPFLQTCYSEMDSLFKMARTIVPAEFAQLAVSQPADQRKYCIELVRRGHHNQMDRNKIIQTIAGMVPTDSGFSVDIKGADIVLLVEILGRTTGISVLPRYNAGMHKFNIRTIFEVVTGIKQEAETKEAPPGEGKRKRKQENEGADTDAAAAAAAAATSDAKAEDDASSKKQRTDKTEAVPSS